MDFGELFHVDAAIVLLLSLLNLPLLVLALHAACPQQVRRRHCLRPHERIDSTVPFADLGLLFLLASNGLLRSVHRRSFERPFLDMLGLELGLSGNVGALSARLLLLPVAHFPRLRPALHTLFVELNEVLPRAAVGVSVRVAHCLSGALLDPFNQIVHVKGFAVLVPGFVVHLRQVQRHSFLHCSTWVYRCIDGLHELLDLGSDVGIEAFLLGLVLSEGSNANLGLGADHSIPGDARSLLLGVVAPLRLLP